jgi:hypothetical protein
MLNPTNRDRDNPNRDNRNRGDRAAEDGGNSRLNRSFQCLESRCRQRLLRGYLVKGTVLIRRFQHSREVEGVAAQAVVEISRINRISNHKSGHLVM